VPSFVTPQLARSVPAREKLTTTGKLHHPHILAILDSHEVDGFLY